MAIAFDSVALIASPHAPTDMSVSDTAQWTGSFEAGAGWSKHPFFRVRYLSETQSPATKLRIQVGLDPEFTSLIWDSGFSSIAPTSNGELTPAVAYAGPALLESATYYWRGAVRNAEGAASPFSPEPAAFTVSGPSRPCDLRVTAGSGNEQVQGNPAPIGTANPRFGAEYAGDLNGEFPVAIGAEVQVSLTSDFEWIVATSGIAEFAPVAAGARSPLIALTLGTNLEPMVPYFWRYRFIVPEGPDDLWSECQASFVYVQPVAGEVSPGGFTRTSRNFGLGEQATSDLVLADVDGNGTMDAIATSSVLGQGHLLFSSFASATPAPAAVFAAGRGGRALMVTGSFDPDPTGLPGVVIADQMGLLHYRWETGQGFQLVEALEFQEYGEPVALQSAHVDWDGRLDVVIAYEHHVVVILAGKTGFSEPQLLCETESVVSGLLVHDLIENGAGGGLPQILVLAGGVALLFSSDGEPINELAVAGATAVTLVGGPLGDAPQVAFAGPQDILLCRYLKDLGGWVVDQQGPHGVSGTCLRLVARNLNAEATPELVLQCAGCTVVLAQTANGFAPLEYVGHAGGPAEVSLLTAHTDLDDFPDIVIARSTGQHSVFRNESRLGVQLSGSSLTHFGSKDSYAEFEVRLDAAPAGTVTVDCETFEPGNGGDDDRLPDTAEFARGQSSLPYVPTSSRLVFTPGQTVASFRVQVLPGYHAATWTIHARIVSAVGATVAGGPAITTVYGVGAGTSGQAAQPGLQREWRLRGEVHAMTVAQDITYLGGTFDGVEWQASGMAVLDTTGAVRFRPPQFLAAPDIRAVKTDASGNVYIGGRFEIAVPGQPGAVIRNIAKIRWDGTLDSAFRPNPHMQGTTFGAVNAIELDTWGRVYFGGKFDRLENPPVSNMPFRNLAIVHATGTVPSDANRFGVAQGGGGSNGEVYCMRIGETGTSMGEYCLVVGGNYLGGVWLNNSPLAGLTISNLAVFGINGSPSVYAQIPRVYGGSVNAIEIVPGSYGTSLSNTIVFGGSFSGVYYGTTYYNVWNLAVTNLLGQPPASSPGSQSRVNALVRDSHGRIWAGRSITPSYGSGTPDALAVYTLTGGQLSALSFSSGLNNNVLGIAAGSDEVLVVGSFTAAGALPAGHLAAYSAQSASFGTLRANLRVSVADTVRCVSATWSPTGACTGYAIAGAFQQVVALRGNLAAVDRQGNLLAWCPGTNGPVLAMTTDGASVYFGGSFTTCGGMPRAGAAAATANDYAMLPNGFNPGVSGATATVRTIVYDGAGAMYLGGDFTHVGGTTSQFQRTDVARVNKTTGSLDSWLVPLDPTQGKGVYALLHDAADQRIYIGGDFGGTTSVNRPGIVAVTAGTGTLVNWDAQITGPCRVWGIAGTSSDIVFIGNFTDVGGQARDGAAGADRVTAAVTTFQPQSAGSFKAIAATGGTVYLGGDFASLTEGGGTPFTRRGVAALSPSGLVQAWTADVLGTGLNESVRVVYLEGIAGVDRVWVGGRFSGTAHVGQNDLTWFPGSWSITTQGLPPAQSGQPYGPIQVNLSEVLPATWTILSPAAPGLQIDSSGQISGLAPTLQHWQPPLLAPVLVMADHSGQTCSKWFVLTVLPPPPPTVVSVTGPIQVIEGNQPALTPAPLWTVTLNQVFGADVVIHIDYADGLARRGYEYAPLVTQVIIPAGHYSAQFPVTIFGNTQQDIAYRDFVLILSSATGNVQVTNPQYPVTIEDDDFPSPRPAFVRWLQVRENATTPANSFGVVADQPYLAWSFGSDFVGEAQSQFQVQLSHDQAFGSLVWNFTSPVPDASEVVQVGVPVPMGQDCYARVRVWPTATGQPSEWRTISYHRNWAPPAAMPIEPVTTVHTARPMLRWSQDRDTDGDPLHFVIKIQESGGSTLHIVDSRSAPGLFEVLGATSWQPMTAGGLTPAAGTASQVRLRVPASWALAPQPVSWVWSVTTLDPYEAVVSSSAPSFDIDPMYEIAGTYHDPNGGVGNRTVHAVAQGGTLLATATTDPTTGAFQLLIPAALAASDLIAVIVDPASGAHAAALIRFPGSDLVDPSGTFAQVSLHSGKAVIDSRGLSAIALADVISIPHQPGLPLVATPPANDLVLEPAFSTLELRAHVEIRGVAALPGEPTNLRLLQPAQKLRIHAGAALTLGEGAASEVMELDNQGSLTVGDNATLALNGPASSSGQLWVTAGASVLLNAANLNVDGGTIDIGAATVYGSGLFGVMTRGADLRIAQSTFQDAFLDVGADLTALDIDGLAFIGGAAGHCIRWRYHGAPFASLNDVTFDSVTGFNVSALASAARVELTGSGGDHAGEAFDDDPGEATGGDLVAWLAGEVSELCAYAGDSRVLLTWNAGGQAGPNFHYEVFVAAQYSGPFTLIGTTGALFFVHDPATNDAEQFYKVRPHAWGNPGTDSDIVVATPRAATVGSASPTYVETDGIWPAVIVGNHTHFGASTFVNSATSGMTVPGSSILVLSRELLLFDIETQSVAMGPASLEVVTPDVWSEHGFTTYQELLPVDLEVIAPPSPNYPKVSFVQTGGAVDEDEITDGAFLVAVEFDSQGGADIDPDTFECVLDRDFYVGGSTLVQAGENIAGAQHALWGTPGTTGATWSVEQILVTSDLQQEWIASGELVIRVRVANEYGFWTQWHSLRIYIGGNGLAIISGELVQGQSNQTLYINGDSLNGADWVEFSDSDITVTDVNVLQGGGSSYGGGARFFDDGTPDLAGLNQPVVLEVKLDVGPNATVGKGTFDVVTQGSPPTVLSTGSYWLVRDQSVPSNTTASYPFPMANAAAVNVTLQNGEFTWRTADIGTKGRAFPVMFDRTYRSGKTDFDGPLGRGWFGTYLQYLVMKYDTGTYPTPHFDWYTPNGDKISFVASWDSAANRWKFATPVGVAASAWHEDKPVTQGEKLTLAITIQTAAGLRFTFGGPDMRALLPDLSRKLPLVRVADANDNQHTLEYTNLGWMMQEYRLDYINGDAFSESGFAYSCECLKLAYHTNGKIAEIHRVARLRIHGVGTIDQNTFESVKYWYSANHELTLQQLPTGHRWSQLAQNPGELWNGYIYQNGLLTSVLSPAQCAPSFGSDTWHAVAGLGSGQEAEIVNTYTQQDGPHGAEQRVTSQQLPGARTLAVAYQCNLTSHVVEIATVTQPDNSTLEHMLNGFGQADQVKLSDGTNNYVTEYEYHQDTRATIRTTYPGNSSLFLMYAHSEQLIAQGDFSVLTGTTPPLNQSWVWLTGIGDLQNHHRKLIKLARTDPYGREDFCRYVIVEPGSGGQCLLVYGDLAAEGWTVGKWKLYGSNSNPLSRYKVIQERRTEGRGWTAHDLVTTYAHEDTVRYGQYFPNTSMTVDSRGNKTFIVTAKVPKWVPQDQRADMSTDTWATYTPIRPTGRKPYAVTVTSRAISDRYGRKVEEQGLRTDGGGLREVTTYHYWDGYAHVGQCGQPSLVVTSNKSGSNGSGTSPKHAITTYSYDQRGHLAVMRSPRGTGTGDPNYLPENFDTLYKYNAAGQLVHVKHPPAGAPGDAVRPETYYFYDKNGRVTSGISYLSSTHTGTSSGSSLPADAWKTADSELETTFQRPTTRRGSGWLHTKYTYNTRGEVTSVTTDIDAGAVTATTQYEYDIMGRLVRQTDPSALKTEYTYDIRGLTKSVTIAAGDASLTAESKFAYDVAGNLVWERSPLGTVVEYEYDGFGRRTRTVSPAPGGELVHEVTYPKPTHPNIVKQVRQGVFDAYIVLIPLGQARIHWSQQDELGNTNKQWQLARDRNGAPLSAAVTHDGYPAAETGMQLTPRGEVEKSWAVMPGTQYNSATVLSDVSINGFGWVMSDNLAYSSSSRGASDYSYDIEGNVTKTDHNYLTWNVDSPQSQRAHTRTEYDPAGNVCKSFDHFDAETKYLCNNLGWVEAVIGSDGRRTETEYDFAGRPTMTWVKQGSQELHKTETQYNISGQPTLESASRNGTPQQTLYEYDKRGRLTKRHLPAGGEWVYEYDLEDRQVRVKQPDGKIVHNKYDSAGNLVLRVVTNGVALDLGTLGTGSLTSAEAIESFEFNEFGEITRAECKSGSGEKQNLLTFKYNTLGAIEHQELKVYEGGQLVSVDVAPHWKNSTQLGFQSLYETNPYTFSSWSMESAYNAHGIETEMRFWDSRRIEYRHRYTAFQPYEVRDSQFPSGHVLLRYDHEGSKLASRQFGDWSLYSAIHIAAPRPGIPGKSANTGSGWQMACSVTRFTQDQRLGTSEVRHLHKWPQSPQQLRTFSAVETRRDRGGNPVLERRVDRGGLSRLFAYDVAGRMTAAINGHHLPAGTGLPPTDLDASNPYVAGASTLQHQWRREYQQDTVDNITGFNDYLSGTLAADTNITINADARNVIESRDDVSGQFSYETSGRITGDPTTGLTHEHNWRGQIVRVLNGSTVLRRMDYDCFGRMVHQVDAPGTTHERGTVFVPNIGFGGDGAGADTAAEVTWKLDFGQRMVQEIVQFTYGLGAVTGGIGWKRLVEFVAYCGEFAPYYRFLHEDAQGNTIATTSLYGDRLDDYDYTDYGVPVHAPVALDGRWISNIAPHGTWADVSIVSLRGNVLSDLELLGCELRVAKPAQQGGAVFATGIVISHNGSVVWVRDVGGQCGIAWGASNDEAKAIAAFYDLRAGMRHGVMKTVTQGTVNVPGSPHHQDPCLEIEVEHDPFEAWMLFDPFGTPKSVAIRMGPNNQSGTLVTVANNRLIVVGAFTAQDYGPGKWFTIDGSERKPEAAQTGTWTVNASATQQHNGDTVFTLDAYAAVTEFMEGWVLQPDVNQQVFVPIKEVSGNTVSVRGNYAALGQTGTSFRIYAPPGVTRRGTHAGTLSRWVAAESSRCLYAGYRYESPLAGFEDGGTVTSPAAACRQTGPNYAGLYYTLHRHYDPVQMRFTGPDPAAAQFWNLHFYAGNNPARYTDPDGLDYADIWNKLKEGDLGGAAEAYWKDAGAVADTVKTNVDTYNRAGWDHYAKDVKTAGAGYTTGAVDSISPHAGDWLAEKWRSAGVDVDSKQFQYGRVVGNVSASVVQMALTGGGCMWAKGLSVALTVSDFGHAAYAASTGDITSAAATLVGQTIGFGAGRLAKGHVICFVEGTEVAAEGDDGQVTGKPIEQIEVGDLVWARNEFTGQEGFKPVVQLFRNTSATLVHVTYTTSASAPVMTTGARSASDGLAGITGWTFESTASAANSTTHTLTGTPEHPFWSVTRGSWVAMGELTPGETLSLAGGPNSGAGSTTATVTHTRTEHLATPVTVYNFEVADWHTYHVGTAAGWVFVHNKCNGNSVRSGKAQHGYEILDTKTGEIVKTGISGGKRTAPAAGGTYRGSTRANKQAAQWSREAGEPDRYVANVVHEIPAGPWARLKMKKWEEANALRLRDIGQLKDLDKHRVP
ncbi:MAG: hypothetical protein IT464_07250 [Planctomycetes bacterium]|nr:hypothetical protein [Planctomycetota bacterium]